MLVHLRPDVRDDRRRDQEDRRRRHRERTGQLVDTTASATAPGNEKKDGCEVCDLSHGDATPTRLPGTPPLNLAPNAEPYVPRATPLALTRFPRLLI